MLNPCCPSCGFPMSSTTVVRLLFDYSGSAGAILRDVLRRRGNVAGFECSGCGVFACWE